MTGHQLPFNFISVILCGGQSRRMGTDKGLLAPRGEAWVTTLQQELSAMSLPVYVSIRADQQVAYRRMVPAEQLVVDGPWKNVAGPLVGILSVAQAFPSQHLLVVPCDMPQLRRPVFGIWLSAFYRHISEYQAFISQTTQRWQPLCGIYHREGLDALLKYYQRGQLQSLSMHAVLEKLLPTYPVEIPTSLTPQFANYNTPEDLV